MGFSAGRRETLGGDQTFGENSFEKTPGGFGRGNYAESPGKVRKSTLYREDWLIMANKNRRKRIQGYVIPFPVVSILVVAMVLLLAYVWLDPQ